MSNVGHKKNTFRCITSITTIFTTAFSTKLQFLNLLKRDSKIIYLGFTLLFNLLMHMSKYERWVKFNVYLINQSRGSIGVYYDQQNLRTSSKKENFLCTTNFTNWFSKFIFNKDIIWHREFIL